MSLFDLATSPQKASDMAKQLRIQEYKSDGGNLVGNLKFRFSASEAQHWIPSASYILFKFAIGKGTNGTTALVTGDNVNLAQNPGACAISGAIGLRSCSVIQCPSCESGSNNIVYCCPRHYINLILSSIC